VVAKGRDRQFPDVKRIVAIGISAHWRRFRTSRRLFDRARRLFKQRWRSSSSRGGYLTAPRL
jgi:hypothetical protein